MQRSFAPRQDEEGNTCSKAFWKEVIWIRRARRAYFLEHRHCNARETIEYKQLVKELKVVPALEELEAREQDLRRWAQDRKATRLAKWRTWLDKCSKYEPRKVYSWLRGGQNEGFVNPTWGRKEAPVEIAGRVKKAENEWGGLWQNSEAFTPIQNAETLPVLTVELMDNGVSLKIRQEERTTGSHGTFWCYLSS